jgi:hypothetical protein
MVTSPLTATLAARTAELGAVTRSASWADNARACTAKERCCLIKTIPLSSGGRIWRPLGPPYVVPALAEPSYKRARLPLTTVGFIPVYSAWPYMSLFGDTRINACRTDQLT